MDQAPYSGDKAGHDFFRCKGYVDYDAASAVTNLMGVDLSPYAVGIARSKGLSVFTGVLETANFEPGSFDLLTMQDVLDHLTEPVPGIGKGKHPAPHRRSARRQHAGLRQPLGAHARNAMAHGAPLEHVCLAMILIWAYD
jgi:hypothetical protein